MLVARKATNMEQWKQLCVDRMRQCVSQFESEEWKLVYDRDGGDADTSIPDGCVGREVLVEAKNGEHGKRRYVFAFWAIPDLAVTDPVCMSANQEMGRELACKE